MRRWIRWASFLYPPDWRRRYEAEFGALLEDVDPHWSDLFDVLREALFMHLKSFWNYRRAALVCGLAGAIAACSATFLLNDRYVSYATIRIERPEQAEALKVKMTSRRNLIGIIASPDLNLYQSERRSQPLEDVIQTMIYRDLRIGLRTAPGGTPALQIAYQASTPRIARAVTQALASGMVQTNRDARLEMLDPANLPQRPIWPNRPAITLLGLIGGIVIGIVALAVRRRAA